MKKRIFLGLLQSIIIFFFTSFSNYICNIFLKIHYSILIFFNNYSVRIVPFAIRQGR